MKMQQEFEVAAPIDVVWDALIDVERVAPCLPGANITEHDDDGSYKGTFEVKLGPTTASYRGTLRISDVDADNHRAVLNARGTDKRGQGGATATIVNTLTAFEGGTRVHADTDFTITGRLARFSRSGMIEDISNRMLREFAECLQAQLQAEHDAQEAAAAAGAAGPAQATGATVAGAPAGGAEAAAPPPTPPRPPAARPAPSPAKPVNGIALVLGVLYMRLARLFGRPGLERFRR